MKPYLLIEIRAQTFILILGKFKFANWHLYVWKKYELGGTAWYRDWEKVI